VAIGALAKDGGNKAVVLSAAGSLEATEEGFFVSPVRSVGSGSANLVYDTTTKEIYVGSSSRRYKKDIEDVQAADAARVWDLRPVSYRALEANAEEHKSYGFIAEEVAEIDPRLVFWGQDKDGQPRVEGVNYDQVCGRVRRCVGRCEWMRVRARVNGYVGLAHRDHCMSMCCAGGAPAPPADQDADGSLRGAEQSPRGEGRCPHALKGPRHECWSACRCIA
jgi:hypothetical protein